jgi:hypothetical protein
MVRMTPSSTEIGSAPLIENLSCWYSQLSSPLRAPQLAYYPIFLNLV